jgi:hypothetical protein
MFFYQITTHQGHLFVLGHYIKNIHHGKKQNRTIWLTFLVGVNTALEYTNIDYVRNTNDIIIVYSLLHASTCYA